MFNQVLGAIKESMEDAIERRVRIIRRGIARAIHGSGAASSAVVLADSVGEMMAMIEIILDETIPDPKFKADTQAKLTERIKNGQNATLERLREKTKEKKDQQATEPA